MFKKVIVCIILIVSIMITYSPAIIRVSANNLNSSSRQSMDELDIILVAHRFLSSSEYNKDNIWSKITDVKDIIELYGIDGDVVAFYVSFYPKGYVIVNNNRDYPVAIEFGQHDNQSIRNILDSSNVGQTNRRICYISPSFSVDLDELGHRYNKEQLDVLISSSELNYFYYNLSLENIEEKTVHNDLRNIYMSLQDKDIHTQGSGIYNFIHWDNMPSGSYSAGWVPFSGVTWGTTSEFSGEDHCGTVAAFNVIAYYARVFNTSLMKNSSRTQTFSDLYSRIGKGPALWSDVRNGLNGYVSSRGFNFHNSSVSSFSGIKTATSEQRVCMLLMTSAINNWHWVISVGWREYSSTGTRYVRIVNGWHSNADYFFIYPNQVWSAHKVWISS